MKDEKRREKKTKELKQEIGKISSQKKLSHLAIFVKHSQIVYRKKWASH